MAKTQRTDWCPAGRQDQLTMCRTWLNVFAEETTGEKGEVVKKHEAWGIPAAAVAELDALYRAAEDALGKAQEKETRTEVVNVACRNAFTAMVEAMRRVKRRWLLSPPLGAEDIIILGFRLADKKPSHSGAPTARQVPVIVGRGQASLKLKFEYAEGDPADPANKARRLYFKVVAPGETPPATPEELPKNVPANRVTETLRLNYADSGKTVYMAVQFENGDFTGPFGPMISSVIP